MEQEYHSELFDLRHVCECEKELFREIARAEYLFGRIHVVDPSIGIKVYWENMIDDLQDIENDIPELAIVIVKKYQGQGYGELLLREWLNWIYTTKGYRRINVRIDSSNSRSI
ncbi:MAG: GNAT family N-acetyltransferase [Lachnospiraceae bacterium]|nr:GNAT family N-acetyltransferase [Lachnospiraceae bacterium]